MVSSYWPRPELSSQKPHRNYSQFQSPLSPTQPFHTMRAISEVQEPDDERNIPPLMRQPTTSAIRAPHSGHHTPSTTIPNLEGSFDQERDSYCALGAPDQHTPPRQSFLERQRLALGTCPPIFFAIVQLLMLVYFLDLYLTLPRESSSHLPRISAQYSIC